MSSKIGIIGAGYVGTSIAYALMIQGIARHIVIVDIDPMKLQGEVMDLNHGRSFVKPVEIVAGSYQDCIDADIIIITAGAKQKPDESRLDLVERNINILRQMLTNLKTALNDTPGNPQPILLIVSNPCDILTYFTFKFMEFPRQKIIGSGTVLDSSRLRFEIASRCQVNAQNVHGYIIGEHGDSEVVLWSSVRVGGVAFPEICKTCNLMCDNGEPNSIENNVRNAAAQLIQTKGYTNYAIGLSVSHIVEAILRDQHSILPVSTVLDGEWGLKDVALSLPVIIGIRGVERVITLPISPTERNLLEKSADNLQKIIQRVQFSLQ